MEAIPEHLILHVIALEATSEQLASHVVPTEINPVCHVMSSETFPATEAIAQHPNPPAIVTEAISEVPPSPVMLVMLLHQKLLLPWRPFQGALTCLL